MAEGMENHPWFVTLELTTKDRGSMELAISSARPRPDTNHHRFSLLGDTHRVLIAFAEAADSCSPSRAAAARTVEELARCFRAGSLPQEPCDWAMILEAIDHVVLSDDDAGETSAFVMCAHEGFLVGASVGDSTGWVVPTVGEPKVLTRGDRNAPRIGTGLASPLGFGPVSLPSAPSALSYRLCTHSFRLPIG